MKKKKTLVLVIGTNAEVCELKAARIGILHKISAKHGLKKKRFVFGSRTSRNDDYFFNVGEWFKKFKDNPPALIISTGFVRTYIDGFYGCTKESFKEIRSLAKRLKSKLEFIEPTCLDYWR